MSRRRRWFRSSRPRPAPGGLSRNLDLTLREWLLHHQREIVFGKSRWMGVPAYKNPLDAWIVQEILHEVRPETVVEIGSAQGGGALYLAHLLDLLGEGEVVSVDVDRSAFRVEHPRIRCVTGDSGAKDVRDEVASRCRGRRTLVIHDGDHRRDAVLRDLEAYAPLVSLGSYLIVEDGIIDLFEPGDGIGTREDGPLRAVEAFLSAHPEFEVDSTRERYLLTYNPSGFLRRVREP